MLRSLKDLEDYAIGATDGAIGHVEDFYFDDKAWVIRYLVVDAGSWLTRRKVLISPIAIGEPNRADKLLPVSITKEQQVLLAPQWIAEVRWSDATVSVDLTRQQIKDAPAYDPAAALARSHEIALYRHHARPGYWGDEGVLDTASAELMR